jgi:hypothetical protein
MIENECKIMKISDKSVKDMNDFFFKWMLENYPEELLNHKEDNE